jgi:hypothetical protein
MAGTDHSVRPPLIAIPSGQETICEAGAEALRMARNGIRLRRVPEHVGPESLGLHRIHTATAVANPMETTMTWTNRITIAAALIGGAVALMTYAQALGLPAHFA